MFGGGNKIKLDGDLLDRVKKVAEVAGYASHEEFIIHVLERELAQFELSPRPIILGAKPRILQKARSPDA